MCPKVQKAERNVRGPRKERCAAQIHNAVPSSGSVDMWWGWDGIHLNTLPCSVTSFALAAVGSDVSLSSTFGQGAGNL